MPRGEIFCEPPLRGLPANPISAPCIWANFEFLEAPNKFPVPQGWQATRHDNPPNGSGFEAISARVHKDANGHLYVRAGNNLIVDGNIVIQNYGSGGGTFGFTMNGAATDINPATTLDIVGDLAPVDFDPNAAGVQIRYDGLGNATTDPAAPTPSTTAQETTTSPAAAGTTSSPPRAAATT